MPAHCQREDAMPRLLLVCFVVLFSTIYARADDATDLRDRAMKAHAKDPADLKKFRTHTLKAKGESRLTPEPAPATFELAAVWPGQLRARWEFGTGAMKNTLTLCGSDDRGWKAGSFPTVEMNIEEMNDFKSDAYALWVSTLSTLSDAETKLAPAARSKVNDAPVLGLKVSRRPWPDVTLYFDEKTSLLRKMSYRSRDAGVFMNKEFVYDGYKESAGLQLPTKQSTIVQRREVYRWTEMEYAFPDKIDPKTFEKP
jgi:hypothetical protein